SKESSSMPTADELLSLVRSLAAKADPVRTPGWRTVVSLRVAKSPWLRCTADARGITVVEWTGGPSEATTEVNLSTSAVRSWLLDGVDYTHLIKSGDIEVSTGTQFDLLLLSKSFGLRPERRNGTAR